MIECQISGVPGRWVIKIRKNRGPILSARFQDWEDGGPVPTIKGWVNNPEIDFDIDDLLATVFTLGKANADQILTGKPE